MFRILSDLHLGDRACRVRALAQLTPLFDSASAVVFNGDCIDTRPAPVHLSEEKKAAFEAATAARRAEFLDFLQRFAPPVTLLTGNHDPELSDQHFLTLADGRVFITHGDVLFDDIVPWSRDAPTLRATLKRELATLSSVERAELLPLLRAFRQACAALPQRHHSEHRLLYYLAGFILDTVFPPTRPLRVIHAWRSTPASAAAFMAKHCPRARFFLMGHTHRAGIARLPNRAVLINTGAFCHPFMAWAVDVANDRLSVRRIVERRGESRVGETLVEFALEPAEEKEFSVSP